MRTHKRRTEAHPWRTDKWKFTFETGRYPCLIFISSVFKLLLILFPSNLFIKFASRCRCSSHPKANRIHRAKSPLSCSSLWPNLRWLIPYLHKKTNAPRRRPFVRSFSIPRPLRRTPTHPVYLYRLSFIHSPMSISNHFGVSLSLHPPHHQQRHRPRGIIAMVIIHIRFPRCPRSTR